MLTVFLFLNLSFKDFSLTVLVPVIDDKNKMKQDGDLQSQAQIRLSKVELRTDILSRDGR